MLEMREDSCHISVPPCHKEPLNMREMTSPYLALSVWWPHRHLHSLWITRQSQSLSLSLILIQWEISHLSPPDDITVPAAVPLMSCFHCINQHFSSSLRWWWRSGRNAKNGILIKTRRLNIFHPWWFAERVCCIILCSVLDIRLLRGQSDHSLVSTHWTSLMVGIRDAIRPTATYLKLTSA